MGLRAFDRALLAVAVTACGRIDFIEPRTDSGAVPSDGATDTPGMTAVPLLLAATTYTNNGPTLTTPVTFGAGHLLIAGFTIQAGGVVLGVVDATGRNTFVSAGAASGSSGGAVEIWYAANSQPETTSITATVNNMMFAGVWILEVSGIATTAPIDVTATGHGEVTTTAVAATVMTRPNDFVFSVLNDNTGSATAIAIGNPFVALQYFLGDDAAYAVAPTAESFGAVWDVDGMSDTCSSTAAFKAAPL